MRQIIRTIYTAQTRTRRGRANGLARSSDGLLDIRFSTPGSIGIGTNPEQLFAAGWSCSFASAIAQIASEHEIELPYDVVIDAEIDLALGDSGQFFVVRLKVSLQNVPLATAKMLVDEACLNCPYSSATRNNIDVTITFT